MKRLMAWMATAATLTFTTPGQADQNDRNLDGLFAKLKQAASEHEARRIEQRIWRIWTSSGDEAVDTLMAQGIVAMTRKDFDHARAAFDEVIRRAPEFAEGWNKRATLNYLTGDYRASVADVERTLALEPRHFGALSGLGMISLAIGEEERALEAFDAALEIHPRLPGAETHIRALREKLHGRAI